MWLSFDHRKGQPACDFRSRRKRHERIGSSAHGRVVCRTTTRLLVIYKNTKLREQTLVTWTLTWATYPSRSLIFLRSKNMLFLAPVM